MTNVPHLYAIQYKGMGRAKYNMVQEDFSALFAIQKALEDHQQTSQKLANMFRELDSMLNDLDEVISQHRTNMSMVIVNNCCDPHMYLSLLPAKDGSENASAHLRKHLEMRMQEIKNVLQNIKMDLEKDVGTLESTGMQESQGCIVRTHLSMMPIE